MKGSSQYIGLWSLLLAISLIILYVPVSAQALLVESSRLLETDLTANTYGTIEYDQNGEKAACQDDYN